MISPRFRHALVASGAVVALAAAGLLSAPAAGASDGHESSLFVSQRGMDSPSCGSVVNSCRTIGQAVANAPDGGRVIVFPGTYAEQVDVDEGAQARRSRGDASTRPATTTASS